MRQRRQRTPTRNIVRYSPQATWMKKQDGVLHDQLLRRRKKEKAPFEKAVLHKSPLSLKERRDR